MQEGKWEGYLPIIKAYKVIHPNATNAEIARFLVDKFKLDANEETVRKAVSRLIFEGREENILIPRVRVADLRVDHLKYNKPGTYVVLGCWHVPFDNKRLTDNVAKLISDINPQGLILNGDFLDCNSLSGHDRGKFTAIKGLDLDKEYALGQEALDLLTSSLSPEALKVYLYGNHEDRWRRFVGDMQNAKTPPPSPFQGLDLQERGFHTIESYQSGFMTLGAHLDIMHGVYFNTHCAKTHIDRFRGSVMFAHTHRIQTYIEGHTGGFNIGWGGDVNSAAFNYADRGVKASWQNGFNIVNIDEEGAYYTNQVIANNGKFYFNGKLYN